MIGDKTLLLILPVKCDLRDLHTVLLGAVQMIKEYTGNNLVDTVLENFHQDELAQTRTSDRGIMFSKEGARIWNDASMKSGKAVNPRGVVWSLHLALQALDLGQGYDAAMDLDNCATVELSSVKYMTFTVQAYSMYPLLEWKEAHFSKDQQNQVVAWIRSGRDKIVDRDQADVSSFSDRDGDIPVFLP